MSHQSHQGMSKTKAFIRTFAWFPGIDAEVERQVRRCLPCQAVQDVANEQPIKPNELPTGPWQYLEMDFQGPYPNGEYVFAMVDRYTRWPEIDIFRSAPDAKGTIKSLKTIFTNKGVPEVCQSDNGPPFQSYEMKEYSKQAGYYHKHITPEWPRANGTVERFNRSMKKAIQASHVQGVKLRDAAHTFVGMYRATPHRATGVSPYAAMHGGRQMKGPLPVLAQQGNTVDRDKDQQYRKKMEESRRNNGAHELVVGDTVLMRQAKRNKLTPAFSPEPLKVVEVKGSSVMVSDGQRAIMRDGSYFKKFASADEEEEEDDDPFADGVEASRPQEQVVEVAIGAGEDLQEPDAQEQQPQLTGEEDGPSTAAPRVDHPRRENRQRPVRFRDGEQ